MTENISVTRWRGLLSKVVLFRGSKSERECLVLETPERRFRLRMEDPVGEQLLNRWIGRMVELSGVADDTRGHWRLSVSLEQVRNASVDSAVTASHPVDPLTTPLTVQAAEKTDGKL